MFLFFFFPFLYYVALFFSLLIHFSLRSYMGRLSDPTEHFFFPSSFVDLVISSVFFYLSFYAAVGVCAFSVSFCG